MKLLAKMALFMGCLALHASASAQYTKAIVEGVPSSGSTILVSTRTGRVITTGLRVSSAAHVVGTATFDSSTTHRSGQIVYGAIVSTNTGAGGGGSHEFYDNDIGQVGVIYTGNNDFVIAANNNRAIRLDDDTSTRILMKDGGDVQFSGAINVLKSVTSQSSFTSTSGGYVFPDGTVQTSAGATGSGTNGTIAKFTGTSSLGNSTITEDTTGVMVKDAGSPFAAFTLGGPSVRVWHNLASSTTTIRLGTPSNAMDLTYRTGTGERFEIDLGLGLGAAPQFSVYNSAPSGPATGPKTANSAMALSSGVYVNSWTIVGSTFPGVGTSSVTFTSLGSSAGRSYQLRYSYTQQGVAGYPYLRFAQDTSASYKWTTNAVNTNGGATTFTADNSDPMCRLINASSNAGNQVWGYCDIVFPYPSSTRAYAICHTVIEDANPFLETTTSGCIYNNVAVNSIQFAVHAGSMSGYVYLLRTASIELP